MSNRPTLTVNGNHKTVQADEAEERAKRMATTFVSLMDNSMGWSAHELHEDAVMDWFGCCLRGRSSIVYFLKSHVTKTHHIIERVSRIPPVSHRLIKRFKTETLSQTSSRPPTEECGQGDCKGLSTPENAVLPNLKEMVKAPRVKRPGNCSVDWEKCEFLEILGKLEFEGGEPVGEKKLERIILAYTDQIHLVIYEAKNNCRKKLFS